jgi:ABC-type transport system involved in multi-copper enzyme maturation permease subunit
MITIARLVLREAARKKLLWVLAVLTFASVAVTGWGLDRLVAIAQENGNGGLQLALGVSQVLILVAFMFSFVLAMTAAFLAAPAISGEIESGVAQAMLARPLRRADLLLGTWLGLVAVVAAYAVASGLLEIAVVAFVSGYTPPDPIGSVVYLAGQAVVLLTFGLVLSTRLPAIAGGAISVVVFGLAWMMGVLGGVGSFFGVDVLSKAADVTRVLLPTDVLWRGVVFALEPPAFILLAGGRQARAFEANPFYASSPPEIATVAWALAWIALALGLGVVLLNRREI